MVVMRQAHLCLHAAIQHVTVIVTAKMHHVYVFVCVQLKEKPTTKNKKQ